VLLSGVGRAVKYRNSGSVIAVLHLKRENAFVPLPHRSFVPLSIFFTHTSVDFLFHLLYNKKLRKHKYLKCVKGNKGEIHNG